MAFGPLGGEVDLDRILRPEGRKAPYYLTLASSERDVLHLTWWKFQPLPEALRGRIDFQEKGERVGTS